MFKKKKLFIGLIFLLVIVLVLSNVFALPSTTFSATQRSGYTDSNIILTCVPDSSGCKYINYAIDSNTFITYSTTDQNLLLNLKHYYKLDESSGTIIDYGLTPQNLTNSGAVQNVTGIINKAVNFDGILNVDSLSGITSLTNAQTMNVWVYYNSSLQFSDVLFSSSSGATDLYFNYRTYNNASGVTKPSIMINGVTVASPLDIGTGSWHMLTYTWSGSNDTNGIKLYIDGSLVAEGTAAVTSISAVSSYFGRDPSLGNNNSDIKIDEIGYWDTNLNASAISKLYNSGAAKSFSNLNGYDSNTTSFLYSGVGTHTIYYYSTSLTDLNESTNTGTFTINAGATFPNLSYSFSKTAGFGVDSNVPFSLTCSSPDRNDNLSFDVNLDGVNIYHASDYNGATDNNWFMITTINPTWVFSCTDASGNITSQTSNAIYDINFYLVKETTGSIFTINDFNIVSNTAWISTAKIYSIDGNYNYDLKANNKVAINFVGPITSFVLQLDYNDVSTSTILRQVNPGYLPSKQVPICVPLYQQFHLQQFTSGQARIISLYNDVGNCYLIADALSYGSGTTYAQYIYTLPKPYVLSATVNGITSTLLNVDGSQSNSFNLDSVLFSRQSYNYQVGQDTVVFSKKLNPITNEYDLNIVQIAYHSLKQDNTSFLATISLDGTNLASYSNTSSPNDQVMEYYYGSINNLTDLNWFQITITLEHTDNSTNTITKYFNISGNVRDNNISPIFFVIVSLLFAVFGITLASTGKTFGFFGAIILILAMVIAALAIQVWYVGLLEAGYLICLLYIFFMGKPSIGAGGIY